MRYHNARKSYAKKSAAATRSATAPLVNGLARGITRLIFGRRR